MTNKQLDDYLNDYEICGTLKVTDTETGETSFDDLYNANDLDWDQLAKLSGRNTEEDYQEQE